VNALREAARVTAAQTSARYQLETFTYPGSEEIVAGRETGWAEPATRRSQGELVPLPDLPPADSEAAAADRTRLIRLGDVQYVAFTEDQWIRRPGAIAGTRPLGDPLWGLGVAAAAHVASASRPDDVRGVACSRIEFCATIEDVAAFSEFAADPPPAAEVTGVAWLDDEGRIRRITWRLPHPEWERSVRRQLDLWDFGVPVRVEAPSRLALDMFAPGDPAPE